MKLIKDHWHGSRHISVIINETYKFNLQSSLIKFIILINRIKQKQYILLLSRLMCKKNVRTKTIRGKTDHLLTFESQKLNYFGKKVGPAF